MRWTGSDDITDASLFGTVVGSSELCGIYSFAYLLQGGGSMARDSAGFDEQPVLRKRTSGYEAIDLLLSSLIYGTSGIVRNRK